MRDSAASPVVGIILLLGIQFVIVLVIMAPISTDGTFPDGEDVEGGEHYKDRPTSYDGTPCSPITVPDRVVAWKCKIKPDLMQGNV